MLMIKRKIALAASLLALSSSAMAALYEYGPYIEGNVGALNSNTNYLGYHQDGLESAIVNFTLGYQWSRYFSVEGGVSRFQKVTGGSLNSAQASLKASYPFSVQDFDFTVFGKAGPAYYFNGSGNSETDAQTALGGTVSRNEKTDYIFQLTSEPGEPFNYNGLLVGMVYHFD